MLQVTVGREAESLLLLAGGVEPYEVSRDVLEFLLGLLFQAVPCPRAELVDCGFHPLLASVFGELVEGVDGDEDAVVVLVDELDHLLGGAVDLGAQQSAELPHAVVDMDDVVAGLNRRKLFEREGELARPCAVALERVFVEAVENLMVGEEASFQPVVDKTLVEGRRRRGEGYLLLAFVEDGV